MSELLAIEGDDSFVAIVKRAGKEVGFPGIEKVRNRWKATQAALDACRRAFAKSKKFHAFTARLLHGEKLEAVEMITATGLIVKGNPKVVDPLQYIGMRPSEFRRMFPELVQE